MHPNARLYVEIRDAMLEARQNGILDRADQISYTMDKIFMLHPATPLDSFKDALAQFLEVVRNSYNSWTYREFEDAMYGARKLGIVDRANQIKHAVSQVLMENPMMIQADLEEFIRPHLASYCDQETANICDAEQYISSLEEKIHEELSDLGLNRRRINMKLLKTLGRTPRRTPRIRQREEYLHKALEYISELRQSLRLGGVFSAIKSIEVIVKIIYESDSISGYKSRIKRSLSTTSGDITNLYISIYDEVSKENPRLSQLKKCMITSDEMAKRGHTVDWDVIRKRVSENCTEIVID